VRFLLILDVDVFPYLRLLFLCRK